MKPLQLIVVNGYPRSGKDSFVNACQLLLAAKGYETRNVSSVDQVKRAAQLLGWDGIKDAKGRKFLSDLKDLSTEAYEGPLDYMTDRVRSRDRRWPQWAFFFHIREPQEIAKFVTRFPDTTTIFLHRKEAETHHDNTGDSAVLDYSYDYHVDNNSTLENLRASAQLIMEELCVL